MIIGIFLGMILLFGLIGIGVYNQLVRARNAVKDAFADIDVELTRRYDLIPNLVEVAKRYLKHEQETLTQVTAARNQAAAALKQTEHKLSPDSIQHLIDTEQSLSKSMGGLYATFEAYPELKADTQMLKLQQEISDTENRISYARSQYNASVTEYNNSVQVFPNNLLNHFFRFQLTPWLEVDAPEKREAVKIHFD
ncbi:LemA family protein [Suttonella ornithocola]|uniref:LemA family n=1 Tax=Suttonella ornithocola TaxID=279832 RepID=A0A380MTI6_9GAMM|nr:LemA family protein [Suttonella ornithocola]SUO95588.1 LemA family [Suttonella ornithocola]